MGWIYESSSYGGREISSWAHITIDGALQPIDNLLVVSFHPTQVASHSVDGLLGGTSRAGKQFPVFTDKVRQLTNK